MWCPWNVPSRMMSRHHWYIVRRRRIRPRVIKVVLWKCIQIAKPEVIRRAATAPVRGHGLGSTM